MFWQASKDEDGKERPALGATVGPEKSGPELVSLSRAGIGLQWGTKSTEAEKTENRRFNGTGRSDNQSAGGRCKTGTV